MGVSTYFLSYVDDILLACKDIGLLHETKQLFSKTFDMKDLRDASFVLGIEIRKDRSHNLLGLSQKAYIDCILSRFNMQNCRDGDAPVVKCDKFNYSQCPKNDLERVHEDYLFSSAVRSLMYA